jgi:hypothetical protein
MPVRFVLALTCLGIVSFAWAAETFQIRPGRWEVVMQMDFGDRKMPAGMVLDEPMKKIDCISKEDLQDFNGFMPPPEDGCQVSNYRSTGKEISYLMKCGDMTMDFKATAHTPDSFSAVSKSHGKDPNQQMVMKLSARRIGDACTVEEAAEPIVD